jgi:5-methylcytosine-specific restriction endonuclease McrA
MDKTYNDLLLNPLWIDKRKKILIRDNHRCRSCGKSNGLHVHHRQYHIIKRTRKFKLPWEYKEKYLITLCENCHSSGHKLIKVPIFEI